MHKLKLTPDGWRRHAGPLPDWITYPVENIAPLPEEDTLSVLPTAARILNRMIPDVPVLIVPRLLQEGYDSEGKPKGWAGVCFSEGIALSFFERTQPWDFIDTCLHEAWHAVEARMPANDLSTTYAHIQNGIPLPEGYYDSPVERSARSFAAWALYQLSVTSRPMMPKLRGPRTAEHIYWEVLTGNYHYGERKNRNLLQLCVDDLIWLASSPFKILHRMTTNREKQS